MNIALHNQLEHARMKDGPELAGFTSASMAELSHAVLAGDADAFKEFYRRYAPRVYGLLMVLTNAQHDLACDLLNTVMLRVARKFQPSVAAERTWAWLATISRNAVVDHIRAETRRRGREEASAEIVRLERLPEAAGITEMIAALNAAICELAPEEQTLLKQFYFEAVPQTAIAESNNTTVKAVQSRLARIRQHLKRTLARTLHNENEF